MDAYRITLGPNPGCATWPFLRQIIQAGQPPLDIQKSDIRQLQEHEQIVFFPKSAIRDISRSAEGRVLVHKILICRCHSCGRCDASQGSELHKIENTIIQAPATILLALLIYIGHGYLIRYFAAQDRCKDSSLDSVTTIIRNDSNNWKKRLATDNIEAFCRIYDSARNLFDPQHSDQKRLLRHMENSIGCHSLGTCLTPRALRARSANSISMKTTWIRVSRMKIGTVVLQTK